MTLGIEKLIHVWPPNSQSSWKKCLVIIKIVADKFLLCVVIKHQCNMFTMCSFFNKNFTATGNNNTMYSKNNIGNRIFHSKLPIIAFQINSISLIESEEFREPSIISHHAKLVWVTWFYVCSRKSEMKPWHTNLTYWRYF